jgi:hypothetical protein
MRRRYRHHHAMRTIYLQRMLSINGTGALGGRVLVDRLRDESDDLLLGAVVNDEETMPGVPDAFRDDVISEVQLLTFDPSVIMMEGGLLTGERWKIGRDLAEDFVRGGGVLVVADADWNTLNQEAAGYREASGFLGIAVRYRNGMPVAGHDEKRNWRGSKQILCRTDQMVISDWLRPVYDGIPEILCGLPVKLDAWSDPLASGNTDSTMADEWIHAAPDSLIWASVRKLGSGYVVTCTADVSHDVWLEGCPHNTTWLLNVCRFLSGRVVADRTRGRAVVKSPESLFLSHSGVDKAVVSEVWRLLTGTHAVGSWIDHHELLLGDSLPEHIGTAIHRATAFVLFWSAAAAESRWVRDELALARQKPDLLILMVRLDDSPPPDDLENVVRLEAGRLSAAEISRTLAETIRRRDRRVRIQAARERGAVAAEAHRRSAAREYSAYPADASLLRGPESRRAGPAEPHVVAGRLHRPELVGTIRSDYRVDILSFVGGATLVCGSGSINADDVAAAVAAGLVEAVRHLSASTSTDGHLDDHVASGRHLSFAHHDVQIIDRHRGTVTATVRGDESAGVYSAAWNSAGDRVVLGTTNYLILADDRGKRRLRRNLFSGGGGDAAKSVVWQPSVNLCYATGHKVVFADPDGKIIRELTDLDSLVLAVAVAPDRQRIAASARNGQVALWSEWGELLGILDGIPSNAWSASRCLAFSPDGRFLCQAAPVDGYGFLVHDLTTGNSVIEPGDGTDLLAFHPAQPDLLCTAAGDTISFWRLSTAEIRVW